MRKYHDQGHLYNKEFILAYDLRRIRALMAGRQSSKHVPRGHRQEAESSHLQNAITKQWINWKWHQLFRNSEILPPGIHFFQRAVPPNPTPTIASLTVKQVFKPETDMLLQIKKANDISFLNILYVEPLFFLQKLCYFYLNFFLAMCSSPNNISVFMIWGLPHDIAPLYLGFLWLEQCW